MRDGSEDSSGGGIPTVDLSAAEPALGAIDRALRRAGFLLVSGHGIDPALPAAIRESARAFFHLPAEVKQRYAVKVGGRGWLGPGAEANGYAEGTATPPDLKESLSFAADRPTGRPEVDAEWFLPNRWPAEVPELRPLVEEYLARMQALSDRVLGLLGLALGEGADFFTRHTGHPTFGFNVNWYPGRERLGEPEPGQFRIGPHTDFGTVTVLDRQAGKGGLQVYTDGGGWADAPYDPAAFTVNIGDLMAVWTGGRWRSGRHRVLPPPADAPDEELMSLVYFYECDPGTTINGIESHAHLRAQLDAITADGDVR
ncbi:isopenicillin N synthase family dioxygenase [Streptomyces sp. NPDC057411]|uniref:isopenicillin N synthase family dioxygenase n=1 Tax=unclassified Streptomyces TaxID=2593676 RepID=UPI0036383A57